MHRIGYARVWTVGQNLDSQLDALKKAGCTKVFRDEKSGIKKERPGFRKALECLRKTPWSSPNYRG